MAVKNYCTMNGQLIGEYEGTRSTDYILDGLGSVIATFRSTGTIQNQYRYSGYGQQVYRSGTGTDPYFLWVGGWGYRTRGMVYVRRRVFYEQAAVWTSVDPLWPKESAYGYCFENPGTLVDPSGSRPARYRPLPIRLWPPKQFEYGNYCGSHVKHPPSKGVPSHDCIDCCCLDHDRCLEAHYGLGRSETCSHFCCDLAMAVCASMVSHSGCCLRSPTPVQCAIAASSIAATFAFLSVYYGVKGRCCPDCIDRFWWPALVDHYWNSDPRAIEFPMPIPTPVPMPISGPNAPPASNTLPEGAVKRGNNTMLL